MRVRMKEKCQTIGSWLTVLVQIFTSDVKNINKKITRSIAESMKSIRIPKKSGQLYWAKQGIKCIKSERVQHMDDGDKISFIFSSRM